MRVSTTREPRIVDDEDDDEEGEYIHFDTILILIYAIVGPGISTSDEEDHRVLSESPQEENPINGFHTLQPNGATNGNSVHIRDFVEDARDAAHVDCEHAADGSGEETDSEEDEEDSDEEEEEPALKYEVLGGPATALLSKDTASAVAASETFLVSTPVCHTVTIVIRSFRHLAPTMA